MDLNNTFSQSEEESDYNLGSNVELHLDQA